MRWMLLCALAAWLVQPADDAPMDDGQMHEVLRTVDDRMRNSGDWKAQSFIENREKGKEDVVFEAVVYRRDEDDKLMILMLRPKAEQGKGYLRIDKNLWMYDPTVGKWERRTERERIAGTNSTRSDFDESRLAEEYTPKFVGYGKLGKFRTVELELRAKEGIDVAYPVIRLWVDRDSLNVLKRQEYALSGRLMRSTYYPRYKKLFSKSKGADVWFPEEIRIYDELEKGNSSIILIKQVSLDPLPQSIFTKAWLESKSR